MALPITVPYTFGNATTAIPLSNLDSDYATVYQAVNGIGNGSVALANVAITGGTISGNTTASNVTVSSGTFTNVTLSNVTISSVSTPITAAEGGTGLTSFTSGGVVYASSTSALATGSALTFDGTNLVNTSSSVGTPEIAIANSATSAGANARLRLKTGVSGATTLGDAFVQFTDSLNFNWAIGAGSSTSNALTFNQYFGLGSNERMRIDSSGNLLVGTTLNQGTGRISLYPTSGGTTCINTQSTASNYYVGIFYTSTSTLAGYIAVSGGATTYSTASDYRLKENIAPMTGALDKVKVLKPVTFNWIADKKETQGFIAHELQAIVPECVTGEKDAVDENGNPKYQGIDTSFLVATLTSAIQELSTLITAQSATIQSLTERITALENK